MENIKSESGRVGDSAWLFAGGLVNVCLVFKFFDWMGIAVPMPDSAILRLAELIAIGGAGLFAEAVLFECLHSLFARLMGYAESAVGAASDRAAYLMTRAAESGGALILTALKFALLPVRIPCARLWAAYAAPVLERRRQREELRRAFEQMENPRCSFEDFVRDFEAGGSNGSEEDAGARCAAAPSADPFAAACRTLGLPEAGGFGQAELKARYQALMKAVHPDVIGPNVFAAQINEARGIVKARKGWT
jgi:hypothetical protein